MSDDKRSFWSSVPGLITGLAGLLTGIVGLTTLLIQQGIVGHKGTTSPPTSTTVPALAPGLSPTTTMLGVPGTTAAAGSFMVSPTSIDFQPTDPMVKMLTLTNTSVSTPLIVQTPKVTGDNPDRFTAAYATCSSAPLMPGSSCTVKVTFTPAAGAALKQYKASLEVAAMGAPNGYFIGLTATTLL